MPADRVNLVEVFSSIQGEGPEIGTRTLFVRLGECDLRCGWCDSPGTWLPAKSCKIDRPGSGDAGRDEIPNPVPIQTLLVAAQELGFQDHRWVSLTGGEPLLQPDALRAIVEALRGHGPGIFLETHGLHTDALETVIDVVDLVSMDWKLASDVRRTSDAKGAAAPPFHSQHQRFLEVAKRAPRVVVKLVITHSSEDAELDEAFSSVARIHPDSCLVLQPVTPFARVQGRPSAERMHELERRASRLLSEVRVIPQTHPIMEMA